MGCDEHRRPGGDGIPDQAVYGVAADLVQPGMRLVEQPQGGAPDGQGRQRRAAALPGGEGVDGPGEQSVVEPVGPRLLGVWCADSGRPTAGAGGGTGIAGLGRGASGWLMMWSIFLALSRIFSTFIPPLAAPSFFIFLSSNKNFCFDNLIFQKNISFTVLSGLF